MICKFGLSLLAECGAQVSKTEVLGIGNSLKRKLKQVTESFIDFDKIVGIKRSRYKTPEQTSIFRRSLK